MIKIMIVMGSAVLLGACATTADIAERGEDPAVTKALAGKVAGEPKSCLSLSEANRSATYDGTVLYRVNRNLIWRNDMNGCPSLRDDRIPIIRVFGAQICRGDIVQFADRVSGAQFGSCTFGDFVPYRVTK